MRRTPQSKDYMNTSNSQNQRPNGRSRTARTLTLLASVVATGVLAACSSDSVAGPNVSARDGLLSSTIGLVTNTLSAVTGLLRSKALAQPVTRSVLVTRSNGGSLRLPETGLTLTIPAGAIPRDTMTITVTALAGKAVAYEFEPHGTQFSKPLTFTQDLELTSWLSMLLKPSLSGGYFKDASQVNTSTGAAIINEELSARIIGTDVVFSISHFSGYMVSTGRSSKQPEAPSSSPE